MVLYGKPCLSHIFYADFKLQRNKVQSRKLSFAVIENFDMHLNEEKTMVLLLLNEEKTIENVSLILQDIHINKREPWIKSLKRCCAKHGITKRIL